MGRRCWQLPPPLMGTSGSEFLRMICFRGREPVQRTISTPLCSYAFRQAVLSIEAKPRWYPREHQGWMMNTRDCPLVETPDFAAGRARTVERCRGDRRWRSAGELFQRGGRTDLGAGSRRSARSSCELAWGSGISAQHVATPASGQVIGDQAIPARGSEIRIERKDGSRIRAALSLSRVEVGGQERTIAFVRDITTEVERRESGWRCSMRSPTGPTARCRHRSRAAGSSMSTPRLQTCSGTRSRKRRGGGRTSCWWVAIPTAGRWQGCDTGSARKAAARRKSSSTTRTATRSGYRPTSRRSATDAGGSGKCSRF